MLRTLQRAANQASLKVEALEDRTVPTVLVTPPVIPLSSFQHFADHHHGHGEAGGVITVHIIGDTTAGQSLLSSPLSNLRETVTINGSTFVLGMPRIVGANGNELQLKFSRADLSSALGSQFLRGLTGLTTATVSVTNGTATESGVFFFTGRPAHTTGTGDMNGEAGDHGAHGHPAAHGHS